MTTTAAQINVRLDADLKRSGDAALSKAGMTPSQAVRALWQLAASPLLCGRVPSPRTARRLLVF